MVTCVDKLAAGGTFGLIAPMGEAVRYSSTDADLPFPNQVVGNYDEGATLIAQKLTHTSASAHIKPRVGAIPWKLES